jgi:hypothetical protein
VTSVKWKVTLVRLEMVLISASEKCTACVVYTIGMDSFWAYPMELLVDVDQMEARFGPFRDSVNLDAR